MSETHEQGKQKSRVHRYCPKLDKIKFNLKCEWSGDCNKIFSTMDSFLDHVDEHLDNGNNIFECKWKDCDTDSFEDESSFKRHVKFHAFHTKLKYIGQNVLENLHEKQKESEKPQNIPKCNLDDQTRNVIPELPYKFECSWNFCDYTTDNPEMFYRHIKQTHVEKFTAKDADSKCLWSQCEQKIPNKNRLVEHIRHHSQEKLVACPNCGSLFASFTKFIDHCSRSSEIGNMCFQCSHCNKKFATNNLLKEHIRKHVNKFKCPICDMTCIDKKDLSKHILYKHTTHKTFQCPYCSHACKTQYDLQKHVNLKHNERCEYECNECDYKSKDLDKIKKHMLKTHLNGQNNLGQRFGTMYMCHVCKKTYSQGSTLSKHLKSVHNFQWPSGHSRFRYKLETDGFYRLQTLRYESAELVEELNKTSKIMDQNMNSGSNFNLESEYDIESSKGSSSNTVSNFENSTFFSVASSSAVDNTNSNTLYDLTNNQHIQISYGYNLNSFEQTSNEQEIQNVELSNKEIVTNQENAQNCIILIGDKNNEATDRIDRVEFDIEHFLNQNFRVKEQNYEENDISMFTYD